MIIGTFNVRGLNGKADLVQKLVDSTKLDVRGLGHDPQIASYYQ